MAVAQPQPMSVVQRHSSPSGLADVLDVILDKGIVIDVFVRVALVGIELLTIDARIVIASVDTYLHFAEAVNRLDLTQVGSQQTLPEMVSDMTSSGASGKTKGMLEGAKDALFGGGDDEEDEEETSSSRRRSSSDPQSRPRRTSGDSESRPRRTSSGSRPRGR
ncbi:MAG TPA: gas vesicle protein GvpJ [Solirubrobacteraceae bacterium]